MKIFDVPRWILNNPDDPKNPLPNLEFSKYIDGEIMSYYLSNGIIIIDIDDMDMFEALLAKILEDKLICVVVKSERGGHFYFLDNNDMIYSRSRVNCTFRCGLQGDIKVRREDISARITFGAPRELLYNPDIEDWSVIPDYLTPIDYGSRRANNGRMKSRYA